MFLTLNYRFLVLLIKGKVKSNDGYSCQCFLPFDGKVKNENVAFTDDNQIGAAKWQIALRGKNRFAANDTSDSEYEPNWINGLIVDIKCIREISRIVG